MAQLNVEKLRAETPGVEYCLHFENAGAALMPQAVFDAVKSYQEKELHWGGYRVEDEWQNEYQATYSHAADLVNARPQEIAILDSATRAWTNIFYSIPFAKGDVVLTSVAEYASNIIAMLQLEKRLGIAFEVIPNDEHGQVSLAELRSLLLKNERVKLIAITHTPTNGGLVNPAEAIGALAREFEVLYLLDACQTLGQYPLDVNKLACDFLTATGRKYLRAPRGTGILYIAERHLSWLEPQILDIFGAKWETKRSYSVLPTAQRFEFWEKNYAAVAGLSAALQYCNNIGIQNIWLRVQALAESFRAQLAAIPGITVRDRGEVRCGIVTFDHAQLSAEDIVTSMSAQGVNLSTTSVFGTRFDMEERGLEKIVRAAVHYYTSEVEIEKFCLLLRNV